MKERANEGHSRMVITQAMGSRKFSVNLYGCHMVGACARAGGCMNELLCAPQMCLKRGVCKLKILLIIVVGGEYRNRD